MSRTRKAKQRKRSTKSRQTVNTDGRLPKLSIVMPCYNMASFIRDCFDSLSRQTLTEFEAICVDDGSTDETPVIIREQMVKDPRIKLITQPNLGVFAARNNAMKVARGEYICFLDPDDWYPDEDTLARMYDAAVKNGADICGGGWSKYHPDGRIETKFEGFMEGLNTFPQCGFLDYADYQFDLGYQRFLFRTKLIRDNKIEFPPYKRFQDPPFLVKAMIAAGRLYTLDFVTYCYRVGHKSVDWATDDYRKLKDYLRGLADNMRVAKAHRLEKLFSYNRDRACGSFFWQTAGMALATRPDVFEVYRGMFDDPVDWLKSLAAGYGSRPRDLALLLEQNKAVPPPPPHRIRTIGIHYYHLTVGGVQRVIALQVREFLKLNYRVVLFIEELDRGSHFEFPDDVEIVAYPRSLGSQAVTPAARIGAIAQILREHPVDVFYSHAHMSPLMLWDIITLRLECQTPYILHYHSMFTAPLYAGMESTYGRFLEAMPQHRLCDAVISLSRGDLAYERLNGVSAVYLPNPVDPELAKIQPRPAPSDPLIIWVGRLDELKCPLDALRIFAKVRTSVPNVRLRMLGEGTEGMMKSVHKLAEDLKLGDSIELPGRKDDVYADYAEASLCLSTSRVEGFPMVSFEALCHGLPIVAYSLPQVEIYRDNPAVVQVSVRDVAAAAAAVCQMLKNPTELAKLRMAAWSSVRSFIIYDHAMVWRGIFKALEQGLPISFSETSEEDRRLAMEMLFAGIEAMKVRIADLRAANGKSTSRVAELEALRASQRRAWKQHDVILRELKVARVAVPKSTVTADQGEFGKLSARVAALAEEVKAQKAARVKNWNERMLYVQKWREEQAKVKELKAALAAAQKTAGDRGEIEELRAQVAALAEEVKVQKAARVKNWNERTMYVRKWREEQEKVKALQGRKKAPTASAPAAKPIAKPVAKPIGSVIAPDGVDITIFEN